MNRFTVDAPKNHAEESFQIVKDQKTADRIWKKAEGKAAGFYVVEQGVQNQQLSLFDTMGIMPVQIKERAVEQQIKQKQTFFDLARSNHQHIL